MKQDEKDINKVNEPQAEYLKQEIHFFNSFEEVENYHRIKSAKMTQEELLTKLEEIRKISLKQYLLPDGSWPPLARIITIRKPFTE